MEGSFEVQHKLFVDYPKLGVPHAAPIVHSLDRHQAERLVEFSTEIFLSRIGPVSKNSENCFTCVHGCKVQCDVSKHTLSLSVCTMIE